MSDTREQLNTRPSQEVLDAIEELRGMQRPIPTKTEIIEQAVLEKLARERGKKRERK